MENDDKTQVQSHPNPDCQHRRLNRVSYEAMAWICGDDEFPDCHFLIRRIA